jgi:hypothetical protein
MINRYPDRFLFGSDVVAPKDTTQYYAVFESYRPLWAQLSPDASAKVRTGTTSGCSTPRARRCGVGARAGVVLGMTWE